MLPKENRITKKKEFDSFFSTEFKKRNGLNQSGQFMILKTYKNNFGRARFGFIVNNKIDKNAVVRNKIKRQLRKAIQDIFSNLKQFNDCLIIVKPQIKNKDFVDIKKEVEILFKRTHLL